MKKLIIITAVLFTSSTVFAKKMSYGQVRSLAKKILSVNDYGLTYAPMKDIASFCPSYKTLSADERQNFWAHLVTNIAFFESSFNTLTAFGETNGNTSRGLLSISWKSISSKYRRAGCGVLRTYKDLHDAGRNLKCGFAIISTWVKADKGISLKTGPKSYKGAARYWSTLRLPYRTRLSDGRMAPVGKKKKIIKFIKSKYPLCF